MAAWNRAAMTDTEKQYDPDDDPDTGPATTPAEVSADSERDQAEGEDDAGPAGADAAGG
jgi:hypothetical protein